MLVMQAAQVRLQVLVLLPDLLVFLLQTLIFPLYLLLLPPQHGLSFISKSGQCLICSQRGPVAPLIEEE